MIETRNLCKSFGEIKAVNNVSLTLADAQVFGLVGTNGAGKSTFLRMLAGVLRPDSGEIRIDGEPVYDNQKVKEQIFFVPSDLYYFRNASPMDMCIYYVGEYENFDTGRFVRMLGDFGLDAERRISTFSKGMKRQLMIILGLCANTHYLFLDETFDGLDPVMRQAVKSLFAKDMEDRGLTPIIASHNLREIEDICDHVGLLHQGGVLLSEDMEDMKLGLQKVQCVFASDEDRQMAESQMQIRLHETRGRVELYTVKGTRADIERVFRGVNSVFFEILPLTLEEIFISETEVAGYDVRKLILD